MAAQRLLAADTTRALVAAPGVGSRIRVYSVAWTPRVAAAQIVDVGVDGGTVAQQVASIPASAATPGGIVSEAGFPLPENTALSAKPAAAGPEISFLVEYVVEPKSAATA